MEKKEMKHLSPSKLSLMKDCQRCFWLAQRRNIKRPNGIFPSLPSGIDRIAKRYFDSFRAQQKLPPELQEIGGTLVPQYIIDRFRDWRRMRFNNGEFVFYGALDECLELDGKLCVVDFKTKGSAELGMSKSIYTDQLSLYNFLLMQNGHDVHNFGYVLLYSPSSIETKGEFRFDVTLVKIEIDSERAHALLKKALSILNCENPPEQSPECVYCPYRDANPLQNVLSGSGAGVVL